MTASGEPYYHPPGGTKVVNDPCLLGFLGASNDDEAWRALDDLLSGEAGTLMRDTVTRQLARSRWMANHIDDVLGELRVKLTQKLWSLRSGAGEPVENFLAYCTTASERTCYAFLRRQFPERTRLRNRLRYAATHHSSIALEIDAHGVWRCRSTGIRLAAEPGSTRALIDAPMKYAADHGIDREAPLPALVATLLDGGDEPIEFDRLVDAVATLLGVSDAAPDAGAGSRLERVADPAASVSSMLEERASLADVWHELVALPLRQRTALLLNLRDADGGASLHLLPSTSIASRPAIAKVLEMSEAELAAVWDELPFDDLTIASRLGVTRQQVINLRKSARARLARRAGRNRSWLSKR